MTTLYTKHYTLSIGDTFIVAHRTGNKSALTCTRDDVVRAIGSILPKLKPSDDKLAAKIYHDLLRLAPHKPQPLINASIVVGPHMPKAAITQAKPRDYTLMPRGNERWLYRPLTNSIYGANA